MVRPRDGRSYRLKKVNVHPDIALGNPYLFTSVRDRLADIRRPGCVSSMQVGTDISGGGGMSRVILRISEDALVRRWSLSLQTLGK